ncbi:retrotransposon protein, putative, Ty1-copia subclass [Panicum miliaceum]|uniref:Retrotransposon protein, putative, Ty1-copia subclass n=1 Tax=Panicum miliaceum TaxID=4540 RepID=A0A3L6SJP0_PANMI|nr:retrotransposon protein, putative, Ty1-copia subclass [Panicum miliaceum]
MNQFFRATIDGKDGDPTALRYYACNLLVRTMPGGRPFCIMDFIWNELRRAMCDPNKFLPFVPYILYMIERVTKVTFPKDCKHEPLHLRPRSGDAPRAAPLHARATRNPRFDPPTSTTGASSLSRHGHHDSFIKRALKSIFFMCKTVNQEVNENHRDIIEIKSHLGLPYDPTMSCPKIFDEDEETEEEEEPRNYREHPDSNEDEDTSNDGTPDDDDE